MAHGTVGANGTAILRVADRNGAAKTRYRALVAATATTGSASTGVLKLR